MTEMKSAGYREVTAPPEEPTRGAGWVLFAAVMLLLVGTFQAIAGLVALFQDSYYLVSTSNLVVHVDYNVWGWTHLGIGVVALFAGFGVILGQLWARIAGIVLACLSAIVNLAFIAAYPAWGVVTIALDVLVIYALAVHGRGFGSVE